MRLLIFCLLLGCGGTQSGTIPDAAGTGSTMPDAAGVGTNTCTQVYNCANACPHGAGFNECTSACIALGTAHAQELMNAFGSCISTACQVSANSPCSNFATPDAACIACESSAQTGTCAGQLQACLAD